MMTDRDLMAIVACRDSDVGNAKGRDPSIMTLRVRDRSPRAV
jgi:hypothetical protein